MNPLQSGTSGGRGSVVVRVLYAVLVALCLEHTRIKYNSLARENAEADKQVIRRKQQRFVFHAAMVYAVLLLFFLLKAIVPFVGEITRVYVGMDFLASTWAFYTLLVVCYTASLFVTHKLLLLYIKTMNKAKGLFEMLGRSMKDGSKFFTDKVAVAGSSVRKKTQDVMTVGRKTFFGGSRNEGEPET